MRAAPSHVTRAAVQLCLLTDGIHVALSIDEQWCIAMCTDTCPERPLLQKCTNSRSAMYSICVHTYVCMYVGNIVLHLQSVSDVA